MKYIKYGKLFAMLAVVWTTVIACERSYDTPKRNNPADLEVNTTIAQLKAMYVNNPTEILSDIIIGGRVTTTDRYGNFYRTLYIQDETGGIELKIGKTGLYNTYHPGQMVYVKMKNLWVGDYSGTKNIGLQDPESNTYGAGYIDVQPLINQKIFVGEMPSSEDFVTPKDVYNLSELTQEDVGTLVTFHNMYYDGLNFVTFTVDGIRYNPDTVTTWGLPAYPDNPGLAIPAAYAQHNFTMGGSTVVVRTSGYARFARERVENRAPKGTPVAITGIYTVYSGTPQIALNNVTDVVKE